MLDSVPALLAVFETAALQAGQAIMRVRSAGAAIAYKDDNSPVTEGDRQAEAIILAALGTHYPDVPAIAEEAVAAGRIPDISGGTFFLVDPLDGTREFVAGRDEFTVNIALIVDRAPVAGIVYAPARHMGYVAGVDRVERFTTDDTFTIRERRSIRCRAEKSAIVAVASRSHDTPETARFLASNRIVTCAPIGSSLKFGLVAEGVADVYPRFSRTMEWDTAAGDAVLRAAGGSTVTLNGEPLLYGKRGRPDEADFANPNFIAAAPLWRDALHGAATDTIQSTK